MTSGRRRWTFSRPSCSERVAASSRSRAACVTSGRSRRATGWTVEPDAGRPVVAAEIASELERRKAGQLRTGFRRYADVTVDGYLFPSRLLGSISPRLWLPALFCTQFAWSSA